jgi:hypothetical protein
MPTQTLDTTLKQVVCDRRSGMSLTCVTKKHRISRASVCRLMKEAAREQQADIASSQHTHQPVDLAILGRVA